MFNNHIDQTPKPLTSGFMKLIMRMWSLNRRAQQHNRAARFCLSRHTDQREYRAGARPGPREGFVDLLPFKTTARQRGAIMGT